MTALQFAKEEYIATLEAFEGTVGDITEDMLYQTPGGTALPLGATYAHIVFSEDVIINKLIQKKEALFESTYKDSTGVSLPMPAWDQDWSVNNITWSKNVKIDLTKFIGYKKAVFDNTQAYLNSLMMPI